MIKHLWTVVARESVINADNNLISVHDILEELSIDLTSEALAARPQGDERPLGLPYPYEIISTFYKNDIKSEVHFTVVTRLMDPHGKELFVSENEGTIPAGTRRNRVRFRSPILPVTTTGTYVFGVSLKEGQKEHLVSETPVDIKVNIVEK